MNFSVALSIVELCVACYSILSLSVWPSRLRLPTMALTVAGTAISALAIVRGGTYGLATTVKLLSVFLVVGFGFRHPQRAVQLLLGLTILNLVVHALNGEILTKWATAPFLLWCGCYLFIAQPRGRVVIVVLAIFSLLEILQALYMEGRGVLITLALAVFSALLRHQWHGLFWRSVARVLPVIYPIFLLVTLLRFTTGDDLVLPTASNVERSALAFWSINMMPEYVANGPGPDIFFDNVNGALSTAGRERDDDGIDPHSFLLSYWVGLGVLSMAFVYLLWWCVWRRYSISDHGMPFGSRLTGAIFASTAVMSFTLSAPDTYTRMVCALCLGLACHSVQRTLKRRQSRKTHETEQRNCRTKNRGTSRRGSVRWRGGQRHHGDLRTDE